MTDFIQLDYYDFKINIKSGVSKNRALSTDIQYVQRKYARKEKLAEKGILSESAARELGKKKTQDIAQAYAKHVIVGWEGELEGKKLPKYTEEAAVKILADPENDALLADIIEQSLEVQNTEYERDEEELKNSETASTGN